MTALGSENRQGVEARERLRRPTQKAGSVRSSSSSAPQEVPRGTPLRGTWHLRNEPKNPCGTNHSGTLRALRPRSWRSTHGRLRPGPKRPWFPCEKAPGGPKTRAPALASVGMPSQSGANRCRAHLGNRGGGRPSIPLRALFHVELRPTSPPPWRRPPSTRRSSPRPPLCPRSSLARPTKGAPRHAEKESGYSRLTTRLHVEAPQTAWASALPTPRAVPPLRQHGRDRTSATTGMPSPTETWRTRTPRAFRDFDGWRRRRR